MYRSQRPCWTESALESFWLGDIEQKAFWCLPVKALVVCQEHVVRNHITSSHRYRRKSEQERAIGSQGQIWSVDCTKILTRYPQLSKAARGRRSKPLHQTAISRVLKART
ncbi:hypothetical protein M3J09_013120 [Ascochyta lentis]